MKAINSISRVLGYTATGIMIPMMVLTVVDVFMRSVFNNPITGTAELTMLMMVCLPMAIAWSGINKRHVKVDLLMSRFSPRVQAIVDSITVLLGIFAIGFMVWRGIFTSLFELEYKYYASILLPVPIYPFHWALLLGLFVFFLVLITLFIEHVRGAIKG